MGGPPSRVALLLLLRYLCLQVCCCYNLFTKEASPSSSTKYARIPKSLLGDSKLVDRETIKYISMRQLTSLAIVSYKESHINLSKYLF